MLAFAAGCLALANPRVPDDASAEQRKGIDLVFALDVSNSMLATDIAPDRLTRAKQFLSKLMDQLKDDRMGLVVFAGNSYLQMPLTFDQSAARMYVSTASPNLVASQGTSISEALTKAEVAFGEDNERFRSVILITDGETHDEDALEKVKELAGRGIMVNTVGIGSPEGSNIMDSAGKPRIDPTNGQPVVSRLNEDILKQVAAATNGTYVHLQSTEPAVSQILAQYANIEKKALNDTSLYTYTSFYYWLVLPMVLLLLADLLISDRKKQRS